MSPFVSLLVSPFLFPLVREQVLRHVAPPCVAPRCVQTRCVQTLPPPPPPPLSYPHLQCLDMYLGIYLGICLDICETVILMKDIDQYTVIK